jgi:glycerophosphoryl diester phosphodiesterase
VRRIHEVDGRVIAWTVNGSTDAAALADMGVDGLCTDIVPEIRPVVERMA